jgi:ribonuclease HII
MASLVAIDEAGRGPVIGPMVICGVMIDDKEQFKLKMLGVKDSKLLTPKQREFIYAVLIKDLKYSVKIVSAKEIDKAVWSDTTNLNWLEADKSIEILNELKPDRAILDCPSNNINAFVHYIKERVHKSIDVKAEFRADKKYLAVGAASIIAKVTRDREIQKLKKKYNIDFGSGYPSDVITQEFLAKNWNKYDIFRKSWASYERVKKAGKQKKLGEY